jgi:hypothetical protein
VNGLGLLLAVAAIYLPPGIKKRKLAMLFAATADAFRVKVPSTRELSFDNCLNLYAQFTREQAGRIIQTGNIEDIQGRLFQNALKIGQQLKADFNIRTTAEIMRMGRIIYKLLKIDFQGDHQGHIVIPSCFFSSCYSSEVCRLISSLDAGLLAGLSGGRKLSFSHRITEGNVSCRAYLETTWR